MSIDMNNLPGHIAITMDGNGRWATKRNLPRTAGHNEGLKVAKNIVKAASDLGIKSLTLYVFSTENWKRTEKEVGFLMNLIHKHLIGELDFYKENNIRINQIGNFDDLPDVVQKDILEAKEITRNHTGLILNLAINYGGRDEIIRGIKKIISEKISAAEITEEIITRHLDMPECSDVDLLIRTGGEQRLSNFLLWHIPYAEQVYCKTLWPDYTKDEFYSQIEDFQNRNRRFGAEKALNQDDKNE